MAKRDWLRRPPNPVRVELVVDGVVAEEALTPLRDADVDAANLEFGKHESDTPEQAANKDEQRAYFFAAVGLGVDNFAATGPAGIAEELRSLGRPDRRAIAAIVGALVERYTATVESIREAAKDSVRPTGSESFEGAK